MLLGAVLEDICIKRCYYCYPASKVRFLIQEFLFIAVFLFIYFLSRVLFVCCSLQGSLLFR
jgi:hypothetical protein